MSGDAGEEEALVFMLTSWCDIKTKKQIALRSRSQTEREPWSPEGNSSLYPPRLLLTWTPLALYCLTEVLRCSFPSKHHQAWGLWPSFCIWHVHCDAMSFTFLLFVSISTWKNETILTRILWASVIFFAVQITTFLYRRQRWKSFDVAIVQKKKKRGQGFH